MGRKKLGTEKVVGGETIEGYRMMGRIKKEGSVNPRS